jgi:DNA-binding GntR family transcriptional regulator
MGELGKVSAEQFVYESIKEAIYKRKIAPGSALKEQSLCDIFDVSRTPVRAALRRLADEGFVVNIINRGVFIIQVDREMIRQIYDVRVEMEIFALKEGIDRFTEEDNVALNLLINLEEDAFSQRDLKGYLEINTKFHALIVSKANNKFLSDLFHQVYCKLMIYLVFYDNFYVPINKHIFSIQNNKKIIEALVSKDIKKLNKLIRNQCQKTLENLNSDSVIGANVETAFVNQKL